MLDTMTNRVKTLLLKSELCRNSDKELFKRYIAEYLPHILDKDRKISLCDLDKMDFESARRCRQKIQNEARKNNDYRYLPTDYTQKKREEKEQTYLEFSKQKLL